MRERGDNGALKIFQNGIHRFTAVGRVRRQAIHQVARLHLRQHGILANIVQIVPDPLHHLVPVTAKFFVVHEV